MSAMDISDGSGPMFAILSLHHPPDNCVLPTLFFSYLLETLTVSLARFYTHCRGGLHTSL